MRHLAACLRPILCATLLAVTASCARDVSGEPVPAAARLYYPSRAALSPDGRQVVVVNANFDQRFVASWLSYVDVAALVAAGADANAAAAAVHRGPKVPSLGGPLAVAADGKHAYLAHRGLGLLTSFDLVADAATGTTRWQCADANADAEMSGDPRAGLSNRDKKTDCDAAHLLDLRMAVARQLQLEDDPERDAFFDPFALAQPQDGNLAVAFLGTHRVAQLALAPTPHVTGVLEGPARSRLVDLAVAGNALLAAGHRGGEGSPSGQSLLLGWFRPQAAPSALMPSAALGAMPQAVERGPELVRLLTPPGDANRLFVLARRPDTLSVAELQPVRAGAVVDGSTDVRVQPPKLRLRATEIMADQALNELAYLQRPTGNLVVASSFVRDTLYFFADLGDRLALVHRLRLPQGRGPASLVPLTYGDKTYLLVTTFFDHGLDLIDVSSANVDGFYLHARVQDANFTPTNRAH